MTQKPSEKPFCTVHTLSEK